MSKRSVLLNRLSKCDFFLFWPQWVISINEQWLKNKLKYEKDQLKSKPTISFAKLTDIDAKQTITDAKPY